MAATPFISLQEPTILEAYNPKVHHDHQQPGIPKTFLDAMEVREQVFVDEQKVPLENEFDADDHRSCHWVVYASINTTTEPEKTDDDGNTLSRRKSKTISQPIGTIRLVPFPHSPHPEPGSTWAPPLPSSETPSTPPYITDRATSLHDGREPYLKLGRLAVLKEFRGSGIAKILTNAAMTWARENPTYFNPSITEMGMDKMGVSRLEELPVWKGLICVHAQEQVVGTWKRWGFEVDEGMGRWDEEGIMHVGMFTRLPIGL